MTVRATTEGAFEEIRFCLGIDDDHTPFVLRFQRDPFLGTAIRRLRGLRPVRLGTVAQALLRALCGQLILASEARAMERRIIRATTEARREWRHAPPTVSDLARLSPAQHRKLGLHARRGATLVRLCAWELERLKEQPTAVVADRLNRERGLGPWSVGVVCLEGLGRFERGLEGDLGLVKLLAETARPPRRGLGDRGASRAVRGVGGPRKRLHARRLRQGPASARPRRVRPLLPTGSVTRNPDYTDHARIRRVHPRG